MQHSSISWIDLVATMMLDILTDIDTSVNISTAIDARISDEAMAMRRSADGSDRRTALLSRGLLSLGLLLTVP
jgi:hypothetical protein